MLQGGMNLILLTIFKSYYLIHLEISWTYRINSPCGTSILPL